LLNWPPDIFALSALILQNTGAYTCSVHDNFKPRCTDVPSKLLDEGRKLRKSIRATAFVKKQWDVIKQNYKLPVARINHETKLLEALLNLIGVSDEACKKLAFPRPSSGSDAFYDEAVFYTLAEHPDTLCRNVSSRLVRVLPKIHTPQVGLNIRNLSHYLALCPGGDVSLGWYYPGSHSLPDNGESRLHLLLIPHPETVKAGSFSPAITSNCGRMPLADSFGFFSYRPESSKDWISKDFKLIIEDAIKKLKEDDNDLHGVILPEASLASEEEVLLAGEVLGELCPKAFLLVGATEANPKGGVGKNVLHYMFPMFQPFSPKMHAGINDSEEMQGVALIKQSKHHRWKLDEPQISRYGLNLDKGKKWWEHIDITSREINFFSARNNLSYCFLICEDLARQEPVAPIVRAVAPHLVIALLQDGPQLGMRWAARYASVLAEDPGCSVLTLTSSGMVKLDSQITSIRSPKKVKANAGNIVGLWRDQNTIKELCLPENKRAILLKLGSKTISEYSIDGRRNENASILSYENHQTI
jgi:hypothetical protein